MRKRAGLLAMLGIFALSWPVFGAKDAEETREFSVAFGVQKISLDPLHTFTSLESQFFSAVYEGLLVNNPFTLEPMPAAASRWEVSEDERTYRFHIREEAVYSNGKPVRADDFVQSWLRMLDPASKAEYSFLFDPIKGARAYRNGESKDPKSVGARAVGEKTLEVELERPAPYFLKLLCHSSFVPIYPGYLSIKEWGDAKAVVAAGPFIIMERTDSEVLLEKNRLYWDAENVSLDRIRIRLTSDRAAATESFLSGKTQWSTVVDFEKAKDSGKVVVFPMFATNYFYFDCSRPPWNDARVRRALALLLPWDQIRSGELLFPDYRLVPQITGYPEIKGISEAAPDEALKLLSQAGFPGGKGLPPLVLKIGAGDEAIAKKMADAWKASIGLSTDVKVVQADYYSEIRKGDMTMGVSTWVGDYADPLAFLQMWTSDSNLNDAHYSDPAYDKAIGESLSIQDDEERYKKMAQAEEILLSSAAILPIAHLPEAHLIDLTRIEGWFPNPLDIHPFKFIGFREHRAPAGVAALP